MAKTVWEKLGDGDYESKLELVNLHSMELVLNPDGVWQKFLAYFNDSTRLLKELKLDLERECAIVAHPKADLLWQLTAELSQKEEGLTSFINVYMNLAPLLKED